MNNNIKFIVKTYYLDISKESDFNIYKGICEELKSKGLKKDTMFSFQRSLDIKNLQWYYELDDSYIFEDQFNTVWKDGQNGYRFWLWSETIFNNSNIKEGYYVSEGSEKIQEVMNNRCSCNYCGKQYWLDKLGGQCLECQGSEHMEESNYCLTKITKLGLNSYDKKYIPNKEWISKHLIMQKEKILQKEIESKEWKIKRYKKDIIETTKRYNDNIKQLKKEILILKK